MTSQGAAQQLYPEGEYLSFLLRVTDILGSSLDYRETLSNVASAAVATIADVCIIDIGDAGDTEMVGAAHRDGQFSVELDDVGRHLKSEPDRPLHPVCGVLKSGRTYYVPHIDDAWIDRHASSAEHAQFMRRLKYRSMIVVPLVSQVFGVSGALTLVTVEGGHAPFHAPAVTFAEGLGNTCAAAIGKARLYGEAHATAAVYQRATLPRILPQSDALNFYSYYEPATQGLLVGGDWYDAFVLPDERIGLTVGDVGGHGLAASVVMGSMRNALRTAILMEPDIARAIDTVDYLLRTEYPEVPFCTAMLAIIDIDAMTMRLGTAGHPGPRIWDVENNVVLDPFIERDLPLGVRNLSQKRTKPRTIRLEGGLVVFYTDGLVECTRDVLGGEAALNEAIARPDVRHAPDPARAIRDALTGCDSNANVDDIAILVARFNR